MKRPTLSRLVCCTFCLVAGLAMLLPPTTIAQAQEVTVAKVKKGGKKAGKKPFKGNRPSVDVAILLDTSNSMDGLISQAKTQLWNIVQQFADAKKNGQTPSLRVSVFEYGNSRLPASEGYIRQVVQLTNDMDKVSEALFALTTDGGDEYCGTVIREAIKRLDWSTEPNAFKTIFIAGNEAFTQGSVDYQESCSKAIQKGIIVNTIHCGDYDTGVQGKWKHGAEMAEGEFLNINQDRKIVHIKSPQDQIIIKLNAELNRTYLWFGAKAKREGYATNQIAQDENARSLGSSFFSRGATKASGGYVNRGRDLVDTMETDAAILDRIETAQLPEAMQSMSVEERKAHVRKMAAKRAEIKQKIVEASKARAEHVALQRQAMPAAADTFGAVVEAAVEEQLEASGFETE